MYITAEHLQNLAIRLAYSPEHFMVKIFVKNSSELNTFESIFDYELGRRAREFKTIKKQDELVYTHRNFVIDIQNTTNFARNRVNLVIANDSFSEDILYKIFSPLSVLPPSYGLFLYSEKNLNEMSNEVMEL